MTSSQVSRVVQLLDTELTERREWKLGEVPYVFLVARYENVGVNGVRRKVRAADRARGAAQWQTHRAGTERVAVGSRGALARLPCHDAGSRPAWRELFVCDDHAGLTAELATDCAIVKWQHCQFVRG